jgi:hypothetical protein
LVAVGSITGEVRTAMINPDLVAWVREAQGIHEAWVTWLKDNPEGAQQREPVVVTAGGIEHHQLWADRLALVAEALEAI